MERNAQLRLDLPSDQDASGRTLGLEEIARLSDAIDTGTLTSTKGNFVKEFEQQFAQHLGSRFALACSSGTAALHCAFAAVNPNPGDEIVTTSITDMGALTPILYQGAIPVFADVDRHSYNVTADSIERVLSDRTRAIVVTHLFGNPCEMRDILALAARHNLPVIEDAAQAFGATYDRRPAGTLGTIGCFSLQQGKHITTGEGGIVVTDDESLARHIYLFINKAWGYGDPHPDHYFLALNYRMTELQGAVAVAQLPKLDDVVYARMASAARMTQFISGLPGVTPPTVAPNACHSFWKYCLHVDGNQIPGGAVALAAQLKARGIACAPRYIQKPAFDCQIFRQQRTFGNSRFPFTLARPEAVDYSRSRFPETYAALDSVLVLPWNENYTTEHVDYIATSLREAVAEVIGDAV
ncbi:MAG: DegT/DnrJ/EryC1/StrS family aminotransferase [Pirellulaceae bacterium]|nr:DegT/DnrJ/EryC1/StrS family aminotransferase [Planctomycetales bacterium]